jgi:DNA-binding CsgD family transcriptional regulator
VRKQSQKTTKIRALLEAGKTAREIATKLRIKPAFVYQVRYQMNKPARLAKFRAEDAARVASDEAFFQEQDRLTALKAKAKEELVDIYIADAVNTPLAYSAGMRGKYAVPEPVQEVVQVSPDDSANHPAHYDPVNHPPHYKEGGIEVIDFIEAKQLGYHLGNVVKYISRAYHKGGMEDLLKAQWYLNRAIEKGEV